MRNGIFAYYTRVFSYFIIPHFVPRVDLLGVILLISFNCQTSIFLADFSTSVITHSFILTRMTDVILIHFSLVFFNTIFH